MFKINISALARQLSCCGHTRSMPRLPRCVFDPTHAQGTCKNGPRNAKISGKTNGHLCLSPSPPPPPRLSLLFFISPKSIQNKWKIQLNISSITWLRHILREVTEKYKVNLNGRTKYCPKYEVPSISVAHLLPKVNIPTCCISTWQYKTAIWQRSNQKVKTHMTPSQ